MDGARDEIEVLVVEDDPMLRESLVDVLRMFGHRPGCARDGREALETLRSGAPLPRLILLDLMMPRMNGWDFLSERRQDELLQSVPVAVLSASLDARPTTAELLEPSDVLLSKPIAVEVLRSLVAGYLR